MVFLGHIPRLPITSSKKNCWPNIKVQTLLKTFQTLPRISLCLIYPSFLPWHFQGGIFFLDLYGTSGRASGSPKTFFTRFSFLCVREKSVGMYALYVLPFPFFSKGGSGSKKRCLIISSMSFRNCLFPPKFCLSKMLHSQIYSQLRKPIKQCQKSASPFALPFHQLEEGKSSSFPPLHAPGTLYSMPLPGNFCVIWEISCWLPPLFPLPIASPPFPTWLIKRGEEKTRL